MDNKSHFADNTVLISGLFVISLLVIQSYLPLKADLLDSFQKGSLVLLSFALPGLGSWFLAIFLDKNGHFKVNKDSTSVNIFLILIICSIVSAILGIGLAIAHLLPIAGYMFIMYSALNFMTVFTLDKK